MFATRMGILGFSIPGQSQGERSGRAAWGEPERFMVWKAAVTLSLETNALLVPHGPLNLPDLHQIKPLVLINTYRMKQEKCLGSWKQPNFSVVPLSRQGRHKVFPNPLCWFKINPKNNNKTSAPNKAMGGGRWSTSYLNDNSPFSKPVTIFIFFLVCLAFVSYEIRSLPLRVGFHVWVTVSTERNFHYGLGNT